MAAAAGLIAGAALPAGAATADFLGQATDESGWPHGTAHGRTGAWEGGLFDIEIDGETPSQAYCIDISTDIDGNPTYDEVDWATSGVENLATVEAILRHYYPNGDGPEGFTLVGTDAHKAMATQSAIWHFTDGFTLTDSAENPADVITNYETILAAVEAGLEGFGEPTVTLAITPPASTEGSVGEVVGPYVVDTTADAVTVIPSEGVSLVDSEGNPLTDEIVDGTEFWLTSDTAGSGTASATASATATAGRVFMAQGQQTLILAAPVTVEAAAEAAVSFVPSTTTTTPETTTTTAPETTTTTVPTTPDTSIVPPPPTTVPVTPNEGEGGGLPVTGAQSVILAAVALLLVAIGVGFRIVSKRAQANG